MMGRWEDLASWGGPAADNFGDGDWTEREPSDRMSEHRGLVIHIAEGSYAGTIAWERNQDSDISSHWVLARDGRCIQMVDTDDRPWTQGDGNSSWLSVECEGYSGSSLTQEQINAIASLLARAHQVYGVPLQLADSANGYGLGWHGMGGADWGGHYQCPGSAILAQRPAIIELAKEIISGGTMALTAEEHRLLQCGDNYNYYTARDLDVIEYPNPQGGTGTVNNQLKLRTERILTAVAAVASDVQILKARPILTITLTDADRAAIAQAAGAAVAESIGTKLDDLEVQVAALTALVTSLTGVIAEIGSTMASIGTT